MTWRNICANNSLGNPPRTPLSIGTCRLVAGEAGDIGEGMGEDCLGMTLDKTLSLLARDSTNTIK